VVNQPQLQERRISDGPAIAALVLGIVGLFTFGATAVVALILGYATRNRTRTRGLSTAALIVSWSVLGLVIAASLLFALLGGVLSGDLFDTSQFDS